MQARLVSKQRPRLAGRVPCYVAIPEMVAHPGAAPGDASFQTSRVRWLPHARGDEEIGGLCGLCSRDLPLDRRVLFVAELTGRMLIK